MTVSIYALRDPVTGETRYVGKTAQTLQQRIAEHVANRVEKSRKRNWVVSLLRRGLRPEIVLLEVVTADRSWQESEAAWIAKFKASGFNLVNGTNGGDGCEGLRHTSETKARISEAKKGRSVAFLDPVQRAKNISLAMTGIRRSEDTRRKIAAANLGKVRAPQAVIEAVKKFKLEGLPNVEIARLTGVHRHTVRKLLSL